MSNRATAFLLSIDGDANKGALCRKQSDHVLFLSWSSLDSVGDVSKWTLHQSITSRQTKKGHTIDAMTLGSSCGGTRQSLTDPSLPPFSFYYLFS